MIRDGWIYTAGTSPLCASSTRLHAISQRDLSTGIVLAEVDGQIPRLVVDDDDVYFLVVSPDLTSACAEPTPRLARVPRTGGELTTLTTTALRPTDLVDAGAAIYWADAGANGVDGVVRKLAK